MLSLDDSQQSFFVGIRSTFYRLASITGQGFLIILAGFFERKVDIPTAWSLTFFIMGGLFIAFSFTIALFSHIQSQIQVKQQTLQKK